MQPQNVSAEYGDTVLIQCRSTSNTIPKWIIGYPNGSFSPILHADSLPAYIRVIAEGISVSVTNVKYNFTNYTCSLDHIVPDLTSGIFKVVPLWSFTGILTINFPRVSFHLESQYGTKIKNIFVREGEMIELKIIKKGGENYTYNVTVHITGLTTKLVEIMQSLTVLF